MANISIDHSFNVIDQNKKILNSLVGPVPRIGEMIRFFGSNYRVLDVEYNYSGQHLLGINVIVPA